MGDLAGKRRTGVAALPRECGFFVSGFTVFFEALDIGVVLGGAKIGKASRGCVLDVVFLGRSGVFL